MGQAKFPVSPILLALILGPMAEQNMRRSLMLSHDDPSIFVTRPISAIFLVLAIFMAITSYRKFKKLREIEINIIESASEVRGFSRSSIILASEASNYVNGTILKVKDG